MASYGAGNIIRALIMLGLVLLIGTAGYIVIEGWEILDAIYMTVITITTVGYGEVRAVSPTGRVFTIALICMGMGIIAYTLGMVAQIMVELQIRSILGRKKLETNFIHVSNDVVNIRVQKMCRCAKIITTSQILP